MLPLFYIGKGYKGTQDFKSHLAYFSLMQEQGMLQLIRNAACVT